MVTFKALKPGLVAIDGKTSRRSHDRSTGTAPLHLVSAFATTARLVLAQEAVPDKANELAAIPVLLERLGAGAPIGAEGRARLHRRHRHQRRHRQGDRRPGRRLAARGQGQPAHAPRQGRGRLRRGRGRLATTPTSARGTAASRSAAWPCSARSTGWRARAASPANCACPGPPASSASRPASRAEAPPGPRPATSSPPAPSPRPTPPPPCANRAIESRLHWVLDVTFADDQSRLRKGHGA